MADPTPSKMTGPVIPWTWLTFSLAVLAVTSLGTLAVVVSVTNVDALSTIALALAVLAFAAQLIVSLAQAQGGAQQLAQTERTNSETQAALTEVRSTAHALLSNQSEQFNKVLSAALRSATETVVEEVAEAQVEDQAQGSFLDPELIAERVESRLREGLAAGPARGFAEYAWRRRNSLPPIDNEAEGRRAMATLESLSPIELVVFMTRLNRSVEANVPPAAMLQLPLWTPGPEHMYVGLVRKGVFVDLETKAGQHRIELSETGRLLARLMLGERFYNWMRMRVRDAEIDAEKPDGRLDIELH